MKNMILNNRINLNTFIERIAKSQFPIFCFVFDWKSDSKFMMEPNWYQRERYILVSTRNGSLLRFEFYIESGRNPVPKLELICDYTDDYKQNSQKIIDTFKKTFTHHELFLEPSKGNYYKWLTSSAFENIFPDRNKPISQNEDNGPWTYTKFMGLIIKNIKYYWRYSDFGNDNYETIVRGNNIYYDMYNKQEIRSNQDPAGRIHISKLQESEGVSVNIDSGFLPEIVFKYFYNNNELLLVNYDEIVKSDRYVSHYEYGYSIYKNGFPSKLFSPPEHLICKSFILTKQFEGKIENASEVW